MAVCRHFRSQSGQPLWLAGGCYSLGRGSRGRRGASQNRRRGCGRYSQSRRCNGRIDDQNRAESADIPAQNGPGATCP